MRIKFALSSQIGVKMINFDDEIKKFQPSLEVEEAEDAIYNNDFPDVTDIINKIINNLSDK